MTPAALALSAFAALSSISGLDPNGNLSSQWMGQYGQTSVFRAVLPIEANVPGPFMTVALSIIVGDLNTKGGSGGVFSGFDLDFILFDSDGILNGNEVQGTLTGPVVFAGSRGEPSPYQPTSQHPGTLFGLVADGNVQTTVATLGVRDSAYSTAAFAVNTSSGWVSLGDGGTFTAQITGITVPRASTLYVYVGDAGPRQTVGSDGQVYNEDPLLAVGVGSVGVSPEPGTTALIVLGGLSLLRARRRHR